MILEDLLSGIHSGTPLLLLSAGLIIGLYHAFEPDHMAAVSTQIAKAKKEKTKKRFSSLIPDVKASTVKSSILGAFWGLGHTSMILLVSVLVFVFSLSIPHHVFDWFEFMVGLMLITLGVSVYLNKRIFRFRHSHPHHHENGFVHSHPHEHNSSHSHNHKSYLIGCIHGLAGSGSLVAISMSTLSDIQTILSFVLIFGIGSILGMMLVSGIISLPFSFVQNAGKLKKILKILTGMISIIIGIDIMYGLSNSSNFLNLI